MADTIHNNKPLGQDSIKGSIFFGSNLTPGGSFSNVPQTTTAPQPTVNLTPSLVLTLEQIEEMLKREASSQSGDATDPLSQSSINTFLTTFTRLLIDNSDLRNSIFFGSAYTELTYHINRIARDYPFKSYFAYELGVDSPITFVPNGNNVDIVFTDTYPVSTYVRQAANFTYDDSGATNWPNFDIVDQNGTRFPIINISAIPSSPTGPTTNIVLTVSGNVSVNNFVEYSPSIVQTFKGFIVSPKTQALTDFEVSLEDLQTELLSPLNPTPWPRTEVINNIEISGVEFDNWVSDPENLVPNSLTEDLGGASNFDEGGLNLTGALTLDETVTNQLLRRSIPHELVNELNDTKEKFFTRFILVAGKFFDTIKVYIDFLKYTHTLNYTSFNQLSPDYYKLYADHYGFELFDDENIELARAIIRTEPGLRYDSQNVAVFDNLDNSKTIKQQQEEKQKRLLVNLFYLYQTKGTQKCIRFLTSLLGALEDLVVLDEYAFNQDTGEKEVNNEKYHVPGIEYEIDPDFLVNQSNINDPVNLPYVYRLKLSNEKTINLREITVGIDPQAAIAAQIINFGQATYPYANFGHRAYASLQNSVKKYRALPLTIPDKYYGVTVEYLIPRYGYTKASQLNNEEANIHLASLYEISPITPDGITGYPMQLEPIPVWTYPTPPNQFNEDGTGYQTIDTNVLTQDAVASIIITVATASLDVQVETFPGSGIFNSINGGTFLLGGVSLKEDVFNFVNLINFTRTSPNFWAKATENVDGSFTLTITAEKGTGVLHNNKGIDFYIDGNTFNRVLSNGTNMLDGQYIIARIEGSDLVVRLRTREEVTQSLADERVAICQGLFAPDGLNHQLRLIYRPEGVEVYQDFKFITVARWLDPTTATNGPFTSIEISKEEILTCTPLSLDTSVMALPNDIPNDYTRWWDFLVGLPVNLDMFFYRVAFFEAGSIDQPDVLDEGLDTVSGFENEKWNFNFNNNCLGASEWTPTMIPLLGQVVIYLGENYENLTGANSTFPYFPSSDFTNWKQVSLQTTAQYRSATPQYAGNTPVFSDIIETWANTYTDGLITDVNLTSQSRLGGVTRFTQDIQNYYKLPNGEVVTIDSLFKFNGWHPNIHKNYTYDTYYNRAYRNYELFSGQVLTYLSLIPFISLVEDKFQALVKQFIPIVINIDRFGRIIKGNPFDRKKVHYPLIHNTCDGTLLPNPAQGFFTISGGTHSFGVNTIEVQINGIQIALQDWISSNQITAGNIVAEVNAGPHYPNVEAVQAGSFVLIYVDAVYGETTFGLPVNDLDLTCVLGGDVSIENLSGLNNGNIGVVGTCSMFTVQYLPFTPGLSNISTYIYYLSEGGPQFYEYSVAEAQPPDYSE